MVGRLAFFLDCYREEHWNAAICVLCYVKGTRNFVLTLGGDSRPSLLGYADSDFANCPKTSRSIGGYCFSLGTGLISWSSKKQKHTSDLTCYAKYIALYHAGNEVIFLLELLDGLDFPMPSSTPIHCDNDTARKLAEDHFQTNAKHIRVKYHTIRDVLEEEIGHIVRVQSADNAADIFTKPLAKPAFTYLQNMLGLCVH